jgi:hypothetical protein
MYGLKARIHYEKGQLSEALDAVEAALQICPTAKGSINLRERILKGLLFKE